VRGKEPPQVGELESMANVILLPHIAAFTREAQDRVTAAICEDVARVLEEAGIWNRIAANAEGKVEDEDCYTLEVKEVDLVRAGEMVERGLGLPEG